MRGPKTPPQIFAKNSFSLNLPRSFYESRVIIRKREFFAESMKIQVSYPTPSQKVGRYNERYGVFENDGFRKIASDAIINVSWG